MMLTTHRNLFWLCVALATFGLASFNPVWAQIPNLPEAAQRALQAQPTWRQEDDALKPNIQVYQPINPEQLNRAPLSRLETLFTARAGRPLTQFGYNILGVPSPVSSAQTSGIQEDYVLGVGDEVVVVLRGQENDNYRQRVNRNGQIILPNLNPIQAAGRTFGDLRGDIENQVARSYISTNAFVSLGEVRQISVLVTGEVRAPGTRVLSALASPLDALLISGGIAKTGSLRSVTIIRGNQTRQIDLYALLTEGNLAALGSLQNGDRVYVPPLRSTVAVTGFVRRPGIYELRPGQPALSANALINLAGGFEIAGAYRLSKMRLEPDGTTRLIPFTQDGNIIDGEILFVDSNVDVSLDRVRLLGAVRLTGGYPRATASSVGRLIHGVQDLTPDAFTLFAVLVRRDAKLNTRTLIPFSLSRVLAGNDITLENDDLVYIFSRQQIRALANEAALSILPRIPEAAAVVRSADRTDRAASFAQVPGITAPNMRNPSDLDSAMSETGSGRQSRQLQNPNAIQNPNGVGRAVNADGDEALLSSSENRDIEDPRLQAAQQELTTEGAALLESMPNSKANQLKTSPDVSALLDRRKIVTDMAQILGTNPDVLVRMASDYLLWILDKVRDPGAYLAVGGATLDDMISVAGGALEQADLSFVEVTSTNVDALAGTSQTVRTGYKGNRSDFEKVALRPLDVVRLRPIFSDRDQGQVSITGQVRYPGNFDITRSERLSSLLQRAGGLTEEAYAYAAVFTRRRAAVAEYEANLRAARQIESEVAAPGSSLGLGTVDQSGADRVRVLTSLSQQLRDAPVLGRVAVTADPAVLHVRPELDILLEPGDTLYIPKRSSSVTVSGEVLSSGSFQYEPGLGVRDYIRRAGGTTQGADEGRTFLLLPDGSARPAQGSWLSFNEMASIPPGSTIIVPRDLNPFNLGQFLKDATQITSQLAVTAASIVVVGR